MHLITPPPHSADLFGELFLAVQREEIFADQKTFPDCVPKLAPAAILERFREARQAPDFDLRAFVVEHFIVPETVPVTAVVSQSLHDHLEQVWGRLRRDPDVVAQGGSLLPLAHPYVIPGGRFREVYYWDSYFTMLGLRESGRDDLIRAMVDNFTELQRRHGVIPNGNRSYYLTRSHPPVLALMVELIAEREGPGAYARYLPDLEAELDYWNDRTGPGHHRVELPDGSQLQRYYDEGDYPRLEAFAIDEATSRHVSDAPGLFRHLRSAAESGWDFSSRWFLGGLTRAATRTTDLVPVDLNCFLVRLEQILARAARESGAPAQAGEFERAAARRIAAIQRYCWSEREGFYFDYSVPDRRTSPHRTLAAVVPLFIRIASPAQAETVAHVLREDFLRPGGLVTTLTESGEQWDAPNGWAPLHWMAVAGLRAYGHHALAREIATRWIALNSTVFARTGRLMEKYNVVDLSLPAGGGEYPTQDGFGWTNGVLLRLLREYDPARQEETRAGET
ncbi:MAG TPA: alpha,alpha-trehalase TreF [Candidatus Didemnitutus sp.]|nr:alpha,alpha-trehalase TreF [Candidatus Didemnitutus sp.]